MNKIVEKFVMLALILMALVIFAQPALAQTEIFEDTNISIKSKLPPQWLGYKVHVGSDSATVPTYYKVSAVVPGIGETAASAVTTAYSGYGPISSTMALRLMWAPVQSATQYKLYKSVDNTSFYLLSTTEHPTVTTLDEGASVGAAYSAPSPRGGNLTVENDVTVYGGIVPAAYTKAQLILKTPASVGRLFYDSTTKVFVVSTGTAAGEFGRCNGDNW